VTSNGTLLTKDLGFGDFQRQVQVALAAVDAAFSLDRQARG
jgi:hypothetical protein